MQHRASAKWTGTLKNGQGRFATASGAIKDMPYSFASRFSTGKGTNPEEMIGAAHAGCFSMALSAEIDKAGFKADAIETSAAVTLEQVNKEWTVTASHLMVRGLVPGLEPERFKELAESAKANCPISRLLKAKISLDAELITTAKAKKPSGEAEVEQELHH
jgi:osmotically inducible protein OsmC